MENIGTREIKIRKDILIGEIGKRIREVKKEGDVRVYERLLAIRLLYKGKRLKNSQDSFLSLTKLS